MATSEHLEVDPAGLHLPPSRFEGADPVKLHRQRVKYGSSVIGMPPLIARRGSDGELMILDGVTRATRAARYAPGALVPVEITGSIRRPVGNLPTIKDRL